MASSVAANEIEIEVDPLNDHECMAHLMSLIEFMKNEKIYDSSGQKLPGDNFIEKHKIVSPSFNILFVFMIV